MHNKHLWQQAAELLGETELSRRFRVWISGLIKKEALRRSNLDAGGLFLKQAGEVVEDLNKVTGRRYTLTQETLALIKARMCAGFDVDDFKMVHKGRAAVWLEDAKMREYLRPSTLYRGSRFEEYLAAAIVVEPKKVQRAKGPEGTREAEPDNKALIAELMGKPWHGFGSWAEMYKWTLRFPDAASLAKYPMPERIRKMRVAPNMLMLVLSGKSPEWAEAEYADMKQKVAE